jgi:hypothetical protein
MRSEERRKGGPRDQSWSLVTSIALIERRDEVKRKYDEENRGEKRVGRISRLPE